MKNLKRLIILMLLIIPGIASAASSSISVSSANTGVVGNNLNVTVTVSSSAPLGSWQFTVSYDRSYLTLSSVSNTDDCGTSANCAGNANNSSTKSKSYNFTFKVLKSGSSTIRITSADVFGWDENRMSVNNGSRTITCKTQAEIEASYSPNAYLKSITVGDYTLDPAFDKETKEYNVEVPNDVEKVTVSATKEDGNATITGTGEKELQEGNNKIEIVCTAQKGNSLTYIVNINRKELNPIKVTIDGKEFGIVRKKDLLPELIGFSEDTTTYEDTEIPALYNDDLTYKLIGVKDDEGNVYTYLYDEGAKTIRGRYIQLLSGDLAITPGNFNEKIKGFETKELDLDGFKVASVAISDKQYIIKGINLVTKEEGTYLYDVDTKMFIPFDLTNIYNINKKIKVYKIVIILFCVIVLLLAGLNIFKKDNKKDKKKKPIIDEFKEIEPEEIKVEEIKEEPKEELKVEEETISLDDEEDKKKKKKEDKRKKKAEKKRLKELEREEQEEEVVEEEVKEEKVVDDDEVDDPLNDEDDFMDFWETMEIKKIKK